MSSVNKVILIGRVGKDPEIRAFQNGNECANFSLATSEKCKDKNTGEKREKTEWHNISVFGPLVNIVRNYVQKGSLIHIEGKLQTRKWQDQDGNDRYTTEIVLQGYGCALVLLGGQNSGGNNNQSSQQNQGQQSYSAPPSSPDLDDDIPF